MTPATIGEINIALSNLTEKLDSHMESSKEASSKLMECINELNKTCDLTLQQALKTNGRVNIVEPLALDYQETRANIRGAVKLWTIIAFAVLGGSVLLINMYIDSVKRDTADMVYTKIINNLELEYENKSQSIKESKTSSKSN